MKFKLSHLIAFVFVCAIFFCAAGQTLACTCPYQDPAPSLKRVKGEKARVAAVFLGEVISERPIYKEQENALPIFIKYEITFKVDKTWKGETVSEITISTTTGGTDCGYVFETGKKYLVYAFEKDGLLWVNTCSRTTEAEAKKADKEIKILNKLKD